MKDKDKKGQSIPAIEEPGCWCRSNWSIFLIYPVRVIIFLPNNPLPFSNSPLGAGEFLLHQKISEAYQEDRIKSKYPFPLPRTSNFQ
ncbi:MAG: hypothetical protein A2Z27_00675 [candidate division Zixibacteria bacterium RBG_16_50_21]|nr:MAG: hypothetical protein A2Z27_00675 [candidate division Zixibacteria bacterium RBG_16_50_21]